MRSAGWEIAKFFGLDRMDVALTTAADPDASMEDIIVTAADAGLAMNMPGRKGGGKFTEPNLPEKRIVSQDGVEIVHYTKSGDHGPAHLHVNGGGEKTKIGQNGKPIKGSPELSSIQRQVVQDNKADIRKSIRQIMKWVSYSKK